MSIEYIEELICSRIYDKDSNAMSLPALNEVRLEFISQRDLHRFNNYEGRSCLTYNICARFNNDYGIEDCESIDRNNIKIRFRGKDFWIGGYMKHEGL